MYVLGVSDQVVKLLIKFTMVNRTQEGGSGTPCNYKQRDFVREYDQKTTVHVFSKQTVHNMLLRFFIVIMKHAT